MPIKFFYWWIQIRRLCGDSFLEYRCEQVWSIAERRKQSPASWFLESLQQI